MAPAVLVKHAQETVNAKKPVGLARRTAQARYAGQTDARAVVVPANPPPNAARPSHVWIRRVSWLATENRVARTVVVGSAACVPRGLCAPLMVFAKTTPTRPGRTSAVAQTVVVVWMSVAPCHLRVGCVPKAMSSSMGSVCGIPPARTAVDPLYQGPLGVAVVTTAREGRATSLSFCCCCLEPGGLTVVSGLECTSTCLVSAQASAVALRWLTGSMA